MAAWDTAELQRIDSVDELQITTLRRDGGDRKPLPIWMVRVGDDLYIRSVNGATAAWYKAAIGRGAGRVSAAGITKEVAFESPATAPEDDIDAAYWAKYANSPSIVPSIVTDQVRATTLRVTPRD